MLLAANKSKFITFPFFVVVRETAKKTEPVKPVGEDSMEVTSSSTPNEPAPSLRTLIKKTGTAPKWLHPRRLKRSKINQKKKGKSGKNKNKFLG